MSPDDPAGPGPIESYGLIGDTRTAALVGLDGSIDWLCLPRFDSPACFARLLGDAGNGRWRIAPADAGARSRRAYRGDTLILETTFDAGDGSVRVVDCMPVGHIHPRVVRVIEGLSGNVAMRSELVCRFDYGGNVPWVRNLEGDVGAVAGPDALVLRGSAPTHGEGFTTVADFRVAAGERFEFVLAYHPSYEPRPRTIDGDAELTATQRFWEAWSSRCTYDGEWRPSVIRSLLTLKALTYGPTGGIVAAPTTSLPEQIGGVRNWDYRYCWLRDATFVLLALHNAGYSDEAEAWRAWLLRAVAGAPDRLQIMYGLRGERRVPEFEIPWLSGYEGSSPVRVGNAAADQFQLDVYGEVVDVLFQAHRANMPPDEDEWAMTRAVIETVERRWRMPDRGLWEVRGGAQHFTHSKVMAWVALDRAVRAVESFGLEGPVDRWRAVRDEIHAAVCRFGFDPVRNAFTQFYGSVELDASTLLIPLVGFLPPDDPRVMGTLAALERELVRDGFIYRYSQGERFAVDGLPPGEGAFLACSFWLVDNVAMAGRVDEARVLFEKVLGTANDLGLLAEEYDPRTHRLVGNFPQAFSHVGLINSAFNLSQRLRPVEQRGDGETRAD